MAAQDRVSQRVEENSFEQTWIEATGVLFQQSTNQLHLNRRTMSWRVGRKQKVPSTGAVSLRRVEKRQREADGRWEQLPALSGQRGGAPPAAASSPWRTSFDIRLRRRVAPP